MIIPRWGMVLSAWLGLALQRPVSRLPLLVWLRRGLECHYSIPVHFLLKRHIVRPPSQELGLLAADEKVRFRTLSGFFPSSLQSIILLDQSAALFRCNDFKSCACTFVRKVSHTEWFLKR